MPLPRFLILGLACLAGPAQAQKAELPVIEVGSRWQFAEYYTVPTETANRSWVITSIVRSVRHNPYLGTTTVDLVGFQLPN